MPLKVKLKPQEKVVINGAVIENGAQSASLVVLNHAQILRQPDIMQEDEANTPTRRAYFACQLMLLDPSNRDSYEAAFDRRMADLAGAFTNADILGLLSEAMGAAQQGHYYHALRHLKKIIPYEDRLLAPASGAAAAGTGSGGTP